ncbi:MAG: AMP-binding protein [Deinococcales bacterium]
MTYREVYGGWLEHPQAFWQTHSKSLAWYKFPTIIQQADEHGADRWFTDGELNTCYLALDYHIEQGRGDDTALIYDSPALGMQLGRNPVIKRYSFKELRDEVAKTAGMLANLGVQKGDRVIIYMPMIPEAAIAMLACARLGVIHSVVFGGFASHELAVRIEDAEPKVILSASCGIELSKVIPYKPLLDAALEESSHKVEHCIIFQRSELKVKAEMQAGRDLDWQSELAKAQPVGCTPVKATDPLYILYTSGTTGKPKGIVRDNGGHAVALRYSMEIVYGMKPGEVFWAASDVGWVVGHSYIVYAPLISGCTTVLYEGKPVKSPDAGAFWRVIAEHKVRALFTAPTAFRAVKKEDPEATLLKNHDISSLKCIFMAGERLDPPTYEWLSQVTALPVYDHWWQTETGWAICANPVGVEPAKIKAGSATYPMPGFDVRILREDGSEAEVNEQGYVTVKRPLPPSCLATVWRNPERFYDSYMSQFLAIISPVTAAIRMKSGHSRDGSGG